MQHPASGAVALGLSCSESRGIFPDQGQNLRPLHWQADSLLPDPQGSPLCPLDVKRGLSVFPTL